MEPGEEFATERRLSHAEGSDFTHAVPVATRRRAARRAVEGCDRTGSCLRSGKEAGGTTGAFGRSVRAQHAAPGAKHEPAGRRGPSGEHRATAHSETEL